MTIKAIAAIVGQIVRRFLTVWLIREDAKKDARLEADAKAQERMNDADIGIGASDAANVEWLRQFHKRNKR